MNVADERYKEKNRKINELEEKKMKKKYDNLMKLKTKDYKNISDKEDKI